MYLPHSWTREISLILLLLPPHHLPSPPKALQPSLSLGLLNPPPPDIPIFCRCSPGLAFHNPPSITHLSLSLPAGRLLSMYPFNGSRCSVVSRIYKALLPILSHSSVRLVLMPRAIHVSRIYRVHRSMFHVLTRPIN